MNILTFSSNILSCKVKRKQLIARIQYVRFFVYGIYEFNLNLFFIRMQEAEDQNEIFRGPAEAYSFEVRVETNSKLVRVCSFVNCCWKRLCLFKVETMTILFSLLASSSDSPCAYWIQRRKTRTNNAAYSITVRYTL